MNIHPMPAGVQRSPFSRLDARTKILVNLLLLLTIIMAEEGIHFLLLFLVLTLMIGISHIPFRNYAAGLKPFILLILFTVVFQAVLTPGEILWQWQWLKVSREGLGSAGLTFLRLLLIVFSIQILLKTTTPMALTEGLGKMLKPLERLRFPTGELLMIMTISFRFIPVLLQESDDIRKAQEARGADFRNGTILHRLRMQLAMLVPLFNGAFQQADELAIAMECRGYTPGEPRGSLHTSVMQKLDYLLITAALLLFLTVILTESPWLIL